MKNIIISGEFNISVTIKIKIDWINLRVQHWLNEIKVLNFTGFIFSST